MAQTLFKHTHIALVTVCTNNAKLVTVCTNNAKIKNASIKNFQKIVDTLLSFAALK